MKTFDVQPNSSKTPLYRYVKRLAVGIPKCEIRWAGSILRSEDRAQVFAFRRNDSHTLTLGGRAEDVASGVDLHAVTTDRVEVLTICDCAVLFHIVAPDLAAADVQIFLIGREREAVRLNVVDQ